MADKPLLVSFFGGPGTGKSTTAALVFGHLKQAGVNAELVPEVAKDLTWEQRHFALSHQAYMMAKQMRNWDRLNGQVDVILTDTSTLLSLVYGKNQTAADQAFMDWIREDWKQRNTLSVLLNRHPDRAYNPKGRNQTEQEAQGLNTRIQKLFRYSWIGPWEVHNVDTHTGHIDQIVKAVKVRLGHE